MPADDPGLTSLGRLIAEVQTVNRWSYADISQNSLAAGRRLSRSRVESLRNDPLSSISVKAIEALAAGLRVAPDRVARAAMESMGYVVATESLTSAQAITGDPAISEPMRRVLLAALDAAHQEYGAETDERPSVDLDRPRPRSSRIRSSRSSANTVQRAAADDDTAS